MKAFYLPLSAYLYLVTLCCVFLHSACIVLQPVTEPTQRIIERGSCITFDIPPITLTPAATAAERQLLGRELHIESEGWLIASAKSANFRQEESITKPRPAEIGEEPSQNLRRYDIERGTLEYYEKYLQEYRIAQILGEAYDGSIRLVPYQLSQSGTEAQRKIAQEILFEVNKARFWIYQYHLEAAAKNKNSQLLQQIQKKWLLAHFHKAQERVGEWIWKEGRKWHLNR